MLFGDWWETGFKRMGSVSVFGKKRKNS